jgi:hypothetical protein
VPESASPTCPETTPVTPFDSIITPTPQSRSSSSWTRAAQGPTAITRPTTPEGLIAGAFTFTPALLPRSTMMVRNQGTPSRATTSAAIDS